MLFKYIMCVAALICHINEQYTLVNQTLVTKVPNAEPMGYMFQSTNVHMRLRYICEVPEYRNISLASALCCDTEFPLHYSLYLYTFWFILEPTLLCYFISFERCLR